MAFFTYMNLPILLALVPFTAFSSLVIYRLFFHPLSKVPGPKLAAISRFYDFYYDCIQGGKFSFKIEELHELYGPIVRIGPNEVHIQDPDVFDEFYNVTTRLDKDPWYYAFIASQDAGFGTSNVDLHRARRKAMSRFFASSAISNLESSSKEKVLKLCRRLQQMRQEGKPVNLSNAYRCLAGDSVTDYCLPKGFDLLDSVDFADDYNKQARIISQIAVWHRHIPIIIPIFMRMPRWFIEKTSTEGGVMAFDFQTDLARMAETVVKTEKRSDRSVLDGIVNSDAIPESDKTVERITQEARTLVGAGTETTGISLETITFHVLSHPDVLRKLKEELAKAAEGSKGVKDPLTKYSTVQRLSYLTAVMNEGLRLANSVSGRLARVNPRSATTYKSYVLPPGTAISMSIRDNHLSESVFPDALSFKPERWLVTGDELKHMEKCFVPFGRGGRSCIGKELALMNLYLTLASFFHEFDAELFETRRQDIEIEHDFFSPFPSPDSKGLRIMLR
ncbi:hypothetical protein LTR10_013821 [Elasticomyces elasticus]|uniref:Cytochrome P450 n=1 Tax=Exophiala sideris TaxID=1016849 RepID=A0ABR0JGJ3_9EURO|nr:hypothetical protein LTR10_013821 [Elasticomyces elasticus]KAK5033201.1 hypothetical protein LTS07_003502 [Exophiala sideris]KAK5042299.1 hypothetical protein LTR13_002105 [Exophiala sideris]KAK5063745.1 hypothetical protein LTR69_003510 [Exophiala sideris]KAK5185566.1 hypothetical protein LTR44_002555 [Eurotiomycetes sp. CCFEE 6388]